MHLSFADYVEYTTLKGTVYVLSNPSIPNKLKVGYTDRSVNERIAELSSTGVPDKFKLEFSVDVQEAEKFEKFVHKKLSKYWYNKEFFSCNTSTVVEIIKKAIETGDWATGEISGRAHHDFLTEKEIKFIEEVSKKNRLLQEEKERKERARQKQDDIDIREVKRLYPAYQKAFESAYGCIAEKSVTHESSALKVPRQLLSFAISFGTLGLADPIVDKLDPKHFEDGRNVAKKRLSVQEKKQINDLYNTEVNLYKKGIFYRFLDLQNGLGSRELLDGAYHELGLNYGIFADSYHILHFLFLEKMCVRQPDGLFYTFRGSDQWQVTHEGPQSGYRLTDDALDKKNKLLNKKEK